MDVNATNPENNDDVSPSLSWAKFAVAEHLAIRYLLLNFAWFIGFLIPYANLIIVIGVFLYQAKLMVNAKILVGDDSGFAYLYGFFSLIPGIGIMLMLGIRNGAVAALKGAGIPVGILGVSKDNLNLATSALASAQK